MAKKYRFVSDQLYLSQNGKWATRCPRCKNLREFKYKDGAVASAYNKSLCVKCASKTREAIKHSRYGFLVADINKIAHGAKKRGLAWEISFDTLVELWSKQGGKCALSDIVLRKRPRTWSIDRIDNARGYTKNNVQLVHIDLNMMKNHHSQAYFTYLCRLVHEKALSEDLQDTDPTS